MIIFYYQPTFRPPIQVGFFRAMFSITVHEETYKRLKTSPTASTTKKVNKFINNLLESSKITKEASFRLKITDATTPRLYALPKLHKENIPLRPIVSFTDSPTYGLAKELSFLLKPLIGKSKYHIRNSSDFASSITHEILQTDEIMVSFDVVSLFTKVPISSGHRLIWWGGMRYRFAMNPMLHRTILRKSITFANVHLRGNKSKLGLEA